MARLGVEKPKQLLFLVLAERCSHAHVAHNGSGDPIGKAFRGIVAAGAILLKDSVAFVFMLRRADSRGRPLGCFGSVCLILRRRLRATGQQSQNNDGKKEEMLRTHSPLPFQAGKRKR